MKGFLGPVGLLAKALRTADWWSCKAIPFVSLGCASYIHFHGYVQPFRMLTWSGLLLLTISGCAGFGMVLNDWCDRENDDLAGRPSIIGTLRLRHVITILACFVILIFLPVGFLPGTGLLIILAVAECVLLIAYSVSPIRLKDRGGWGVAADSLYAHVLPAMAAWFAFIPSSSAFTKWSILASAAIICVWQFPMGFRGLLGHQILDYTKDKEVGENTLAVQLGIESSQDIIRLYLLPAEVVGTLGTLLIVRLPNIYSFLGLVLCSIKWVSHLRSRVVKHKTLKRMPTSMNIIGQIMRIFWAEWIAISVFISIVAINQDFWPLLVIYLCLRPMQVLSIFRGFTLRKS